MRRTWRWTALVGVALLSLSACGGGETFDDAEQTLDEAEGAADADDAGDAGDGEGADEPASAGTVVVAQPGEIDTMDPAMHRSRVNQAVVRNVFEALVNQDTDLSFIPELATEWEAVDDLTWRFELREGVTFHNGDPFTAEDVKFSIERILDEDQASPRASMLTMIDAVEVEDDLTVVITTTDPSPTLLASLSVNEIVPAGYVQEVGDEEFAAAPVGTGPFTFSEWVPNEQLVLEANPDYWGGQPAVDTVIFRPIPEVAARMAALEGGDVHIAAEVPPDLADSLGGGVQAAPVDGTRVWFLAMNVTEAPFDDLDVRIGVNQAVDRDALVDGLLQGYGRPLSQPAFPEMFGYIDGFEGYAHDAEAASGAFEGASSAQLDVEPKDRLLAEAIVGQLQAAGLDIEVNVLETEAFNERIGSGASQIYLSSWGVAEGDADVIYARHFWSPSRADAFYTGYENAEVDELIVAGRSTVDEGERLGIYEQAVEKVMADAPWAPLLNAQEIYGVSPAVQGFEPSPIGRYVLKHVSLEE
jgi:peptide/nickel transport system substrate-binding protein